MTPDQRAVRIGWSASLACLTALVGLDIAITTPLAALTGLFALAPLIACAVLPTVSTFVVFALSVAAAIASGFWNDVISTPQQTVRVLGVLLIGSAAVIIAEVRVRRERRYAEMAQIAEVAQRAILPVLPHHVGGIDITTRYESAVEGALVGGDLYDCYYTNEVTRLLIGDVRGKGIGGVEQAARVIRAFRQAAARQSTLAEVAADMDEYLMPFFDDEEFVTALLVETVGPDRLDLVSAGHPPALLLRRGDGLTPVEVPHGLPLGTGLVTAFTETAVLWQPGDRMLLYTDGLSEARDESGEFLDLEELREPLAEPHALDGVLDVVRRHTRGSSLGDDLALVLLEHPVS